ncbi:DUF4349 domain-containing protein [Rivularia sp. UHCC 0363]|uniref:DUF4349 domain-containing protein n=1 Tax=Rivularia sp. UHCC 0363 TaxID=3110244 RepID=UPI002B20195A|nr:DUF4349 domain-containing protein [Rivularia sp. UHCC 0363]MEA5597971.1 DUF4349 domain-containing protein [Rivularia sp. UHCC 0363]
MLKLYTKFFPKLTGKASLFLSLFLGSLIFTSCASESYEKSSAPQSIVSSDAVQEVADVAQVTKELPTKKPQLIKKATITVIVNSLDQSVDAVEKIINQQKGYLLSLEETQLDSSYSRPNATVQMRVPQNVLETTLNQLAELGTVQSRNISAEDVGEQIVDFQARLSNLRRTESNLQKIMDKSGSVKDILSVAQELSNVREQIERITAQLKSLQNQVAYSTITLNLQAAVSSTNNQPGLPAQIQDSWNNSTRSLSEFTVGLMKLGIWLLVYSPYLLILVAAGYFLKRKFRSRPVTPTPQPRNSENS